MHIYELFYQLAKVPMEFKEKYFLKKICFLKNQFCFKIKSSFSSLCYSPGYPCMGFLKKISQFGPVVRPATSNIYMYILYIYMSEKLYFIYILRILTTEDRHIYIYIYKYVSYSWSNGCTK